MSCVQCLTAVVQRKCTVECSHSGLTQKALKLCLCDFDKHKRIKVWCTAHVESEKYDFQFIVKKAIQM